MQYDVCCAAVLIDEPAQPLYGRIDVTWLLHQLVTVKGPALRQKS